MNDPPSSEPLLPQTLPASHRQAQGPKRTRIHLDREAWVLAATEVLAQEGVAGLSVEWLAKRLKVTKGSFYWHFRDRKDLLMAVLRGWKEGRIRDILKQTRIQPGHEIEQIYHVIEVYSASRSRKGMLIELAVRDWARRDPDAAAIVAEVDEVRLDRARALFLACGMPMEEASSRCTLLYAYVFGFSLMVCDRFDADSARIRRDIADLIAGPVVRRIPHFSEDRNTPMN
jgi:AcrR family transcriptional regulator